MTLKEFFKFFPITQEGLAERIGINAALMRQYVSGVKKPSTRRLKEIQNEIWRIGDELYKTRLIE